MSKILNSLKKASEKRIDKYTVLSRKKSFSEASSVNIIWLVSAAAIILLAVISGFNIHLYKTIRTYTPEIISTTEKLDQINDLITRYSSQASMESEKIKDQLKDIYARIEQLNQELEAKNFAIDNLTKAKNTLYTRLSELEAEIDKNINIKK